MSITLEEAADIVNTRVGANEPGFEGEIVEGHKLMLQVAGTDIDRSELEECLETMAEREIMYLSRGFPPTPTMKGFLLQLFWLGHTVAKAER